MSPTLRLPSRLSTLAPLLLGFLLVSACKEKSAVQLELQAQDNRGAPIAQDLVPVDGKPAGRTDSQGHLAKALRVSAGQTLRLDVSKESASDYYAPYFEKIRLPEPSPSHVRVKAILYAVPT